MLRRENDATAGNLEPRSAADRFKERLSCYHSETGEKIWSSDFPTNYEDLNGYGDGPRSTPVIDGDRVFLLSPAGQLRCLQLVDGETIWELDLVASFGCNLPTYGMGATPVIHYDLLLVMVGKQQDNANSHSVIAFDKTNGVLRYCLLYTSPSPRDQRGSRMPSSA